MVGLIIGNPYTGALGWVRPDWQRDAACKEFPELSWFPGVGDTQTRQATICGRCLVRAECLAGGAVEAGIWGGLSERARARERRAAA